MNLELILANKPKAKKKNTDKAAQAQPEAYLSRLNMDDAAVLRSVKKLKIQMDCVYDHLNFATDEALIDSYIYEMKSIHMKYKFYINLCKQRGLTIDLF